MTVCTCPSDGQKVPSTKRVIVIEPDAIVRRGNTVFKDRSKVHIFHADCPVHGYTLLNPEEKEASDGLAKNE